MRAVLRGVAAALVAGLIARQAFAEEACTLNSLMTLQMQRLPSGHVTLPITLDGRPSQMLFDTGGVVPSLTSAVVNELRLKRYPSKMKLRSLQGNTARDEVRVGAVDFGDLHFKDMAFAVMPASVPPAPASAFLPPFTIPARGSAGSRRIFLPDNLPDMTGRRGTELFDGVFAPEIFSKTADFDLDFAAGRFTLMSNDHCPGQVVSWPAAAVAVVPFTLNGANQIVFEGKLDDKPLTVYLDTGADKSRLFQKRLRDFVAPNLLRRLPLDEPNRISTTFDFKTLAFEGISIINPTLVVLPEPKRVALPNQQSPEMLLGMDILSHLHVYIAFQEHKLYITSTDAPADAAK